MHWTTATAERLSRSALPEGELARARGALNHLGTIFGDDLRSIPDLVLRNVLNDAPWTQQWLNWLSDALMRLSVAEGYPSLRRRLSSPDWFMEAYSVLQVAERLDASSLEVSFDSPVQIDGSRKVPDFRVVDQNTRTAFFVEVSVLFLSAQQSANAEALDRVIGPLLSAPPDIVYAGRLLRPIDGEEADDLARHLARVIRELPGAAAFREIFISDTVDAAVGHAVQAATVAAWATRRGLQLGVFAGPASNVDLGFRFRRKVVEKAKQLTPDLSNVLVVPAPELFFVANDPRELLSLVRDAIAGHPQIAMAIVSSEESVHSVPSAVTVDGDHLVTSYRPGMTQRFLMVANQACAMPLPAAVQEKICRAFAL